MWIEEGVFDGLFESALLQFADLLEVFLYHLQQSRIRVDAVLFVRLRRDRSLAWFLNDRLGDVDLLLFIVTSCLRGQKDRLQFVRIVNADAVLLMAVDSGQIVVDSSSLLLRSEDDLLLQLALDVQRLTVLN